MANSQTRVHQASYVSPFIDLGESAIWGMMRWRGRQDPEAKVWIQSRAGNDLDPNMYWRFTGQDQERPPFDVEGHLLDAAAYARLKPEEQAPITYDIENWSFWTAPYEFADSSGTLVQSPGRRSVFQLRVDFLSTAREGGEIDFIEFAATKPPLTEEVVGEIYPSEVGLGEMVQFTYAIQATIQAPHSGFDQVVIATPFGLAGVDTVKLGGVAVEVPVQIERPDSTLFSVQLPRHWDVEDSGEWIEVVFRAPVLRYGTRFDGWVRDSARPLEVAQRITPGDATPHLHSEGLRVTTPFSKRLLGRVRVEPRIVTPNGDGVNETIQFSFALLQLTETAPLRVEIFDLSGHLQRVLYEGQEQSGQLHFSWDGRDSYRRLVAPGLYVYRIVVKAAKGRDHQEGIVAVAY